MRGRLDKPHSKWRYILYLVASNRIERYHRSHCYSYSSRNYYIHCNRNSQRMQQHCKRYDHCNTGTNC